MALGVSILLVCLPLAFSASTHNFLESIRPPCNGHGTTGFNVDSFTTKCICHRGWTGPNCQYCSSERIRLEEDEGRIASSVANYTSYARCFWLIAPRTKGYIHIQFTSSRRHQLECMHDFLMIYDGDSVNAPILASISGDINRRDLYFVATSGTALVYFYSDPMLNLTGFEITYSVSSCTRPCLNGVCQNGVCQCSPGFEGPECSQCWPDCELNSPTQPLLQFLHLQGSSPSAGHASVLLHSRELWLFGGVNFQWNASTFIRRLDLEKLSWLPSPMSATNPSSGPSPRYLHTAVKFGNKVFLYGGVDVNRLTVLRELWCYEPSPGRWESIPETLNTERSQLAVAGHAAVVIGTRMLVFFGFSPDRGVLPFVQEFNLSTYTWSLRENFSGDFPGALVGLSAVVDSRSGLVYVFGGFRVTNASTLEPSNRLFRFDPDTYCWQELPLAGQPPARFLHSAVMLDRWMVVIGGSGYSLMGIDEPERCYPSDVLLIDVACARWRTLDGASLPRVLTSATVYNKSVYVFGGHDGRPLSELVFIRSFPKSDSCAPMPVDSCPVAEPVPCAGSSCSLCQMLLCSWATDTRCGDRDLPRMSLRCPAPCASRGSCNDCVKPPGQCLWCGHRCVDASQTPLLLAASLCVDAVADSAQCTAQNCSEQRSCTTCLAASPRCGWCDDGSNTGVGNCQASSRGCLAQRWYADQCPPCTCNGHSQCNASGQCVLCRDGTVGANCERCQEGFYGNPANGGNCTPCECNGQADSCESDRGVCFCHTRGIVGDHCDRCDVDDKYFGEPHRGGTCYYELNTDYQFTFNLSKKDDKHYTRINFRNRPPHIDQDVEFTLNCSAGALVNISLSERGGAERTLYASVSCQSFNKAKFSHQEYAFGRDTNTTFFVYVYEFHTPLLLQISFSQYPKIDLLQFFITFFSCFISLLLIAATFWKLKQRYDSFRRRQQRDIERQQMASRPFAGVNICLEAVPDTSKPLGKRVKTRPVCPVALQPFAGGKAAVLTMLVQLPRGDEEFAPPGASALALASALVVVGGQKKQDLAVRTAERNKAGQRRVAAWSSSPNHTEAFV